MSFATLIIAVVAVIGIVLVLVFAGDDPYERDEEDL